MKFSFIGIVRVQFEHKQGTKSRVDEVQILMEPSEELDKNAYLNPDGTCNRTGAKVMTDIFCQGLIANIHNCHQKNFRDSAEHLRYIIAELEHGFIAVANVSTEEFNTDDFKF